MKVKVAEQLELSLTERDLLKECESVIQRGIETFVEVGNALLTIRDQRLYRETHKTFEEYCRGKWGYARQSAYQLMEAAKVVENVRNCGQIPANESQARPLVGLAPETQREVWHKVLESSPDGKITAKKVVEAARVIQNEKYEAKRAERVERIAEISRNGTALHFPSPVSVLLADPPWRYEHCETDNRAIEKNHYPTMGLDEICRLPVPKSLTDDAILFLWATSPKLEEAFKVLSAWEFSYRTNAVWVKDKIGMGYYFRQQHELLLVGVRGNIPMPATKDRVSSIIRADRTKHSKKPVCVYDVIDAMYPTLAKGEMFCRNARKGWHAWGNEVE